MAAHMQVRTSDGLIMRVDAHAAHCSRTLASMMESLHSAGLESDVLPLTCVAAPVLRKVLEWCEHHQNDPPEEAGEPEAPASDWDAEFVRVEHGMLLELIDAASFLDVAPLRRLATRALAALMEGKTPRQVRRLFGVRGDLTRNQEAEIRSSYDWGPLPGEPRDGECDRDIYCLCSDSDDDNSEDGLDIDHSESEEGETEGEEQEEEEEDEEEGDEEEEGVEEEEEEEGENEEEEQSEYEAEDEDENFSEDYFHVIDPDNDDDSDGDEGDDDEVIFRYAMEAQKMSYVSEKGTLSNESTEDDDIENDEAEISVRNRSDFGSNSTM